MIAPTTLINSTRHPLFTINPPLIHTCAATASYIHYFGDGIAPPIQTHRLMAGARRPILGFPICFLKTPIFAYRDFNFSFGHCSIITTSILFVHKKANTHKTGINQTSTVGLFPNDGSPDGVLDMSGDVWELTQYKQSKNETENDNIRVLRGGS